jgi:hypothetical protein
MKKILFLLISFLTIGAFTDAVEARCRRRAFNRSRNFNNGFINRNSLYNNGFNFINARVTNWNWNRNRNRNLGFGVGRSTNFRYGPFNINFNPNRLLRGNGGLNF